MTALICTGYFLLLWWAVARGRAAGLTVAAVLVALGALAAAARWAFPRGGAELLLLHLLLAAVAAIAGWLVERRRLGADPRWLGQWGLSMMVSPVLLLGCLTGLLNADPEPFLPSADVVRPMPDGLALTEQPPGPGGCGAGLCTSALTVTGRPGQSSADLEAEVRDHIDALGWSEGCQPAGWLINRTSMCVFVTRTGGTVKIILEGSRYPVGTGKSGPG